MVKKFSPTLPESAAPFHAIYDMVSNKSIRKLMIDLFILLIGLVIVPFPRYFLQMKWYRFQQRKAEAGICDGPTYQDLRSDRIQGFSKLLNSYIILEIGRRIYLACLQVIN